MCIRNGLILGYLLDVAPGSADVVLGLIGGPALLAAGIAVVFGMDCRIDRGVKGFNPPH